MRRGRRRHRRWPWLLAALLLCTAGIVRTVFPEAAAALGAFSGMTRFRTAIDALGQAAAGTGTAAEVFSALEGNKAQPVSAGGGIRRIDGVELIPAEQADFDALFSGQAEEEESPEQQVMVVHDLDVGFNEEDLSDDTSDVALPEKVDLNWYRIPFETVTPVHGRITSDFGYRDHPVDGQYKFHYGIDIAAKEGTDILCFGDGVVEAAGTSTINGNYLKIRHEDGFTSLYAHCKKLYVSEGETVKKGQVLAGVGMTGTATGFHLHFQVYHNGLLVDPKLYVQP